ncbi:MAG: 30S ribosomal protein S19e [archaeon]
MVNIREVKASKLINRIAEKLKKEGKVEKPKWAEHIKTGRHAERRPSEKDWWYKRAASILRKLHLNPGTGVSSLRTWYGGKKDGGAAPEHHRKASGKIIRTAIQQLEEAGYVEKAESGRKTTSKGQSLLEKTVTELKSE